MNSLKRNSLKFTSRLVVTVMLLSGMVGIAEAAEAKKAPNLPEQENSTGWADYDYTKFDKSVYVYDFIGGELADFIMEDAGKPLELKGIQADVVFVLLDDYTGDGQSLSDSIFAKVGYGQGPEKSGILCVLNTATREISMTTSGDMIKIFDDRNIIDTTRAISQGIQGESYTHGYGNYVGIVQKQCEIYADKATERFIKKALICIGLSLIISLLVTLGVWGSILLKHKPVREINSSDMKNYIIASTWNFVENSKILTDTQVTHTLIQTNSGKSGEGNGGGSTHSHSSGNSYGGGSTHF